MADPQANDQYVDDARWFDALGTCRCGKPAHGKVMNSRNESMGRYCTKCGEARVRKAEAARDKAALDVPGSTK